MMMSEVGGQAVTAGLSDVILKSGQLPDRAIWPRMLLKRVPKNGNAAGGGGDGMDTSEGNASSAGDAARPSSSGAASGSRSHAGVGSSSSKSGYEFVRRTDIEYTPLFHSVWMLEVVDDAKKSLCEVAEVGFDEKRPPAEGRYELPDGTVVTIGKHRQIVSEVHFRHDVMHEFGVVNKMQTSTACNNHSTTSWLRRVPYSVRNPATGDVVATTQLPLSLPEMIHRSLSECHPEVRRDLCNHSALGFRRGRGLRTKTPGPSTAKSFRPSHSQPSPPSSLPIHAQSSSPAAARSSPACRPASAGRRSR
jgi:hypothetical protein